MKTLPKKLTMVTALALVVGCPKKRNIEPATKESASLTPPSFGACSNTSLPALPNQWVASAIMHPYDDSQVIESLVFYDSGSNANFWVLKGVESGASIGVLQTDGAVNYLTEDNGQIVCSPTYSSALAVTTGTLFPTDAQCIGSSPIMGRDTDWWRASSTQSGNADWYWQSTKSDGPFRMMIYAPRDDMSLFGQFFMTVVPDFGATDGSPVAEVVKLCAGSAKAKTKAPKLMDAMKGKKLTQLAKLGVKSEASTMVDYSACSNYQDLVTFPSEFGMTTFMTGINETYRPFPTVVYYDWPSDASEASMRTAMTYDDLTPDPSAPVQNNAYLYNGKGYNAFYYSDSSKNCCSSLPGLPKTNWMSLDKCTCKGVIGKDVVGPDSELIISCPIDDPQWFWMWYTTDGVPVWFSESNTNSDGTALCLADYYEFVPGATIPAGTFDTPSFCNNTCTDDDAQRSVHHGRKADASGGWPAQCNNCHTPVNDPWVPPTASTTK